MPLTNSIEDATYEMVHSHKVCRTSLNGQILPNQNISDVVNPGMASEVSEFEFAKNPHETTTKAELAQYHHPSLFSPPVVTIINAIENDQLDYFPGLEKALLKHLPVSPATIKGRMQKQQRKGLRSTRANQGEIKEPQGSI